MTERRPTWERSIPRDQPWGGCWTCGHFRPGFRCAAFPDRIPLPIFSGEVDHLVVRPGQVGDTVFKVAERPTGLALRLLQGAAARGEGWAVDALASHEPVAASRDGRLPAKSSG
jgi:hypothetical protein